MKRKFIFLISAVAFLAVTAYAAFTNRGATTEIVYDFTVFNPETDAPTDEIWSYTSGSWGNIRNASAIESPTAINTRLAHVKFTCSGSGNIVWQLYDGDGYGNQLVMNSSGVSINLTEVSAGDEIVFYATSNRDAEFAGQTIAKGADYAEYTLVAEADAPTIAMPRGLTIRTIKVKKAAAERQATTLDFTVFNPETDAPTDEIWSYTSGSWGNIRNASAIETPTAINARLADALFTCSGSGNIVWQLYDGDGYGNQLVMNSSGVNLTLASAMAGDEIVFYATSNRDTEFAGQAIAKGADYAEYTLVAETDAPTIAMPRGLTIRTITIKPAAAETGKAWDFTAITEADMTGYVDGEGNMTGKYSDDPNAWASLYNNAAFEGELKKNATEAFGPTQGLTFKANGSKWVYVRFYPETTGGYHLCSNNKDLQMSIPAGAGKAVIMKIGGNGGTITTLAGAAEESLTTTKSYDYYLLNATADTVSLKLFKNCFIQKISVLDAAPTQADPELTVANASIEMNAEETAQIEYTSKNEIAPTFTTSDKNIADVDANGKITAKSAGTATITVTQTANPYFLAATTEITVKVMTAGETALDKLVASAVAAAENGAATVELADGGEYTLDTLAVCDTIHVTIEGNGAKVIVGAEGAVTTKRSLTVKNLKFDATNGKAALFQLAKTSTPEDTLLYNKYGANGKNAFFDDGAITIDKVSVSGLTTSFVESKDGWALKNLTIKNSIVQLDATAGKFINWQSGKDGMIKNINIEGNTFYNLQANDNIYFLAYNSNIMPAKLYGTNDDQCYWTMKNNTFAQCFVQLSDRYTQNAVAQATWTGNIWFDSGNLSKTRSCTFNFTPEDNSTYGRNANSNKNFATIEDTRITVPTTAYDFNEDALVPYFSVFKRTNAYEKRMGDTRWLVAGKVDDARIWDFSNNATDHAEDWALITADQVNWEGLAKNNVLSRYQNVLQLDTVEAVVTIPAAEEGAEPTTQAIGFTKGLYWSAQPKQLLLGNGDKGYQYVQMQKGCGVFVKDVYAGDTIIYTATNASKTEKEDAIVLENAYPGSKTVNKADNFVPDTVIVLNAGEFEFWAKNDIVRLQRLEIHPYAGDYGYPQLAAAMLSGKTNLRMKAEDVDTVSYTTKNDIVPVLFTSSDETVATVDATGKITAVAPGVAIITVSQAAGATYFGMTKKFFVQVMPDLTFHTVAVNYETEQCEALYSPDYIGKVEKNDNNDNASYYILPEYATWMFFNNGNNGDNVVIAKEPNNAWMKIDFSEGANDSICNYACPVSEKTGYAACYNPSTGGGYIYSMDYYVTGIEAVKFYYHTSASKVGGLRIEIYEGSTDVEPLTATGVSDQKGKGAGGQSFTVEKGGLDKTKNYIVRALREGEGDVLVYAAKFFVADPTGIEEVTPQNVRFADGVIYDLQGRRVNTMKKGDIYIVNGKKFLNK